MLSALNWRIFWRGQTLKIEKVVGFSFEELQNTQKISWNWNAASSIELN